ncbi:MAG: PAS domain-containing protein [Promethearchaeota archaeon]
MPQDEDITSFNPEVPEEILRTITQKSPVGIIVIQDDKVLFANQELAKLIGTTRKNLEALKPNEFMQFMADADKVEAGQRLKWAQSGEVKTKFYDFRIINKKGKEKWIQILPRSITVNNKPAFLAMVAEVTDQKRIDLAYRELVDHSLQGLLIIQNMRVVFANQAFAEISGYTIDELLELTPKQVQASVHPDYQARVWGRMRDRLEGKPVPSHYQFKGIRKDGEERWVEMYVTLSEFAGKPAIQATFLDITERQKAEAKLKESEVKYRGLFDDLPIGLYRTTVEGNIIDANPALVRLLGAEDKETLLQMNASDFYVDRHERQRFEELLGKEGIVTGHDVQFKRLDGKLIWVHDTFRAFEDELGNIQSYEGSLEDITDRVEAEQARKIRERRYRALFEHTSDAIFIISLDMKHLDANPRATKLLGYPRGELIGMPVEKVVAKGEYEDSKRVLRALLAGDPVPIYERIFVKKTGEEFPVEINASLVTDTEGNPLHIQSVARDITERKRAEQALKESEEKYRKLIETSPDAITVTDLEGKVIMVNQQALQLYGVKKEAELIGVNAFDLISHEDVPKAIENMQITLRDGTSGTLEYTLLKRDGTAYPAELNASLLKDADGNPMAFIGVIRDISDRKEAEARYRHLFDSIPVGLFRTTPDGTILDANPALFEMLGFDSKEPLLKRKASSFYLDPEERRHWEAAVALEDVVTGIQTEFKREDGETIWINLSARAIRNKDDGIEYYEGTLEDITDRKLSEDAVKESEAKYRALVDQSLQGIIIIQDDRIVFANPQMKEVVDITREELLDMPPNEFWARIHPDDIQWIQQRLQDRFAGKKVPDRYPIRVISPEGTIQWVEIWVKMIEYQGKPAIQVTLSDVTERMRAEQAIKESEEKYRTLVEQSLFGIVISRGPPLRFFFVNEAFADMMGYTIEALLAMTPKKIQELIHPSDRDLVIQRAEDRLMGKEVPNQYEYRMVKKDGSIVWVAIFADRIEYEGEPAVQAAYMDITERKQAEAALLESEERFRALVEDLSDWVWEMDISGKFVYTNNAVEDIIGFSAGQVLGRTPCDFLHPEDVKRAQNTWAELIERRRPIRTIVIQMVHRDESDVVLEARGRPVFNEAGELLGFRGICRDITDRLKMLEQLRELDERL